MLSVAASSLALHSGDMAVEAAATTTFVTEAAGFIRTELIGVLVARGDQVFALAESVEAADGAR